MSLRELRHFQLMYPLHTVAVSGGNWTYRETESTGPTLLMLPGAQGTADFFYKTAIELGRDFRLIAATPPACAEMERLSDALAGFLDAMGILRVNLLGSSLSGYLVQLFAHKYPSRVGQLILANTFTDASTWQATRPTPEAFAQMDPAAVLRNMLGAIEGATETEAVHAEFKEVARALIGTDQNAETLKSRVLGILLTKPIARAPIADSNIAFIDDDDDPVILPEMRRIMRAAYAGCEHHIIVGGGHYPAILRPQEYAKVIRHRLAR